MKNTTTSMGVAHEPMDGRGRASSGTSAGWAGDINIGFVTVKDTQGRFKGNPHWAQGWGWALYEAKNPALNVLRVFRKLA